MDTPLFLYEREDALASVADALKSARSENGRALFIIGDAGTGKSELLRAAATMAEDSMKVLSARGKSNEMDFGFAFIEQIIGPMEDGDDAVEAGDGAFLHHVQARSQLRALTGTGPLLILLDDLQWADPTSLRLLVYLADRLTTIPVVLIASMRAWPPLAMSAVRSMGRSAGEDAAPTVLEIGPLSRPAATELLAAAARRSVDPEVEGRAFELTNGNPLLITEVARALVRDGHLPATGSASAERLKDAVLLSHLSGLGTQAIACMQAASLLGTRMRISSIQAVAQLNDSDFSDCFDTVIKSGLLREVEDGWIEFRHEIVARAIYADMAPGLSRELHTRAFGHFAKLSDARLAAPHAVAAELIGDTHAIATLIVASDEAMRDGSAASGLSCLEDAIRLSGSAIEPELLERHGDLLFITGRPGEALSVYEGLLRGSDGKVNRNAVGAKAARVMAHTGRFEDALRRYDSILSGHAIDDDRLVNVVLERSNVIWEVRGPAAALESIQTFGSQIPGLDQLPQVQIRRAYYQTQCGDPGGLPELRELAHAAMLETADFKQDASDSGNIFLLHAGSCVALEQFSEADMVVDFGREWFLRMGAPAPLVPLETVRIASLIQRGEVIRSLAALDDLDEQLEISPIVRPYLLVFRSQALCWLGRLDEAEAARAEAAQLPGVHLWWMAIGLNMARAQILTLEGRYADACDVYLDVEERAGQAGLGEPCAQPWAAGAIDTAIHAGRFDQVRRITGWVEQQSVLLPCIWPRLVALGGRAGIAASEGDVGKAMVVYQEALALPPLFPLHRAQIQLRYGSLLRRQGAILGAREALAEATHIAEARGATSLAELCKAELAAAGGRKRSARDPKTLTGQQTRVAVLAASGATASEIAMQLQISQRTVESHLGRIYSALGVSSKAELRQRWKQLKTGVSL